MGSKLLAAAGAASAPLLRLVIARPWLSGTTALAVATVALFALFLIGRWDAVDATSPASGAGLVNGSAQLAAAAGQRPEPDAPQADPQTTTAQQGTGLETMTISRAWTTADDATEFTAAAMPAGEPAIERTAARMSASMPAPRGAWLTGAIEEITDEGSFQHAGRWNDRSLFFPPQTRR